VRPTSLLRQLIGLKDTIVVSEEFDSEGLIAFVRPAWRHPRCSGCGARTHAAYDSRSRRWRHLDLAGMKLYLQYEIRRADCPRCGVRVERVPWAETSSWFTRPFEDHVGYLAQRCDKTTVCKLMRIAWRTVGEIIKRVVARHGLEDPLEELTDIGVDELSYRRHHEYVTVVVDHDSGGVVWAHKGKNADTLRAFFDELGPERCDELQMVTIDMSGAYIKAVKEAAPEAQIVFDRFHVQRLAHDALDQVRRDEVRQADQAEKRELKGTRFALQKNPWNLSKLESNKLADLQRQNKRLYRAYLLKESLAGILDRKQPNVARSKLREWIAWALRSQLKPFVRVAGTLRKHIDGIIGYVRSRLTNARVEGINGKTRTITRRSFGFHCAESLIAMILLCCSSIALGPVFLAPGFTH
jgi:transposase